MTEHKNVNGTPLRRKHLWARFKVSFRSFTQGREKPVVIAMTSICLLVLALRVYERSVMDPETLRTLTEEFGSSIDANGLDGGSVGPSILELYNSYRSDSDKLETLQQLESLLEQEKLDTVEITRLYNKLIKDLK